MTTIRPSIPSNRPAVRPSTGKAATIIEHEAQEDMLPPPSRGYRVIPEQSVLDGLIKRAVAALKKGVYWDRGSILNIEV